MTFITRLTTGYKLYYDSRDLGSKPTELEGAASRARWFTLHSMSVNISC